MMDSFCPGLDAGLSVEADRCGNTALLELLGGLVEAAPTRCHLPPPAVRPQDTTGPCGGLPGFDLESCGEAGPMIDVVLDDPAHINFCSSATINPTLRGAIEERHCAIAVEAASLCVTSSGLCASSPYAPNSVPSAGTCSVSSTSTGSGGIIGQGRFGVVRLVEVSTPSAAAPPLHAAFAAATLNFDAAQKVDAAPSNDSESTVTVAEKEVMLADNTDPDTLPELQLARRAFAVEGACPARPLWSNVTQLFAASHDAHRSVLTVTMEHMARGTAADLPEFLGGPVAWRDSACAAARLGRLRRVARDMARGLAVLHDELRVIHRDVKPANVLVAADGTCKLADFGCAALLPLGGEDAEAGGAPRLMTAAADGAGDQQGTTLFMSPERLRGEAHGPGSDVWSLGLTLLQLALGGVHPYYVDTSVTATDSPVKGAADRAQTVAASSLAGDAFWIAARCTQVQEDAATCEAATAVWVRELMGSVFGGAGQQRRSASSSRRDLADRSEFADFVACCLAVNPASRPSADALLRHPFVSVP